MVVYFSADDLQSHVLTCQDSITSSSPTANKSKEASNDDAATMQLRADVVLLKQSEYLNLLHFMKVLLRPIHQMIAELSKHLTLRNLLVNPADYRNEEF